MHDKAIHSLKKNATRLTEAVLFPEIRHSQRYPLTDKSSSD